MEQVIDQNQNPIPKKTAKKNINIFNAHGRRKEAVARVRLFEGKGPITINGQPMDVYFTSEIEKLKLQKPFAITNTEGKYYATIKVAGSGKSSQSDAILHGLSRALILADSNLRPALKRAGFLTRDPRVKERRKYGLAQKARKGKQSPKR